MLYTYLRVIYVYPIYIFCQVYILPSMQHAFLFSQSVCWRATVFVFCFFGFFWCYSITKLFSLWVVFSDSHLNKPLPTSRSQRLPHIFSSRSFIVLVSYLGLWFILSYFVCLALFLYSLIWSIDQFIILTPIPNHFDYCSFRVSLANSYNKSSKFVLLFQICFGYPDTLHFHMNFRITLSIQ